MRLRNFLYWVMGACLIVVVFGLLIKENIWEISGTINPISWEEIFINISAAILLILLGGSKVLPKD